MRSLCLLGAMALAAFDTGCTETSCNDREPDRIVVTREQGIVVGNTFYSGPANGPFLYFPPARTYVFQHGLGAIAVPTVMVAFSANGNLAPAAGDMAVFHSDADYGPAQTQSSTTVLNNTCADFYLWFAAQAPTVGCTPDESTVCSPGDGAAGASGEAGQAGAAGTAGE